MSKKTLVMKFGGTSVASKDAILNVVKIISNHKDDKLCIVVSALGATPQHGKVTDELIELKTSNKKEKILCRLRKRHIDLINECIQSKRYRKEAKKDIEHIILEIEKHLNDPKYPLECFGERMSVQIMYYLLCDQKLDISYVDAGNIIHFINTNPHFQKITESSELIKKTIKSGRIAVTEGFIANENGKITCMIRGGSDQTATLIGEAIGADEIIIYSDQNGILTADPRIVKNARTVDEISYSEAEEMAGHGAKIIYPKILDPLKTSNIPVIIKNTFNPAHKGTRIVPLAKTKGIKCITMINQTHTSIHNPAMIGTEGFLAKVFASIKNDVDIVMSGNPIIGYTTTNIRDTKDNLQEFGEIRQLKVHTIAIVGEEVEDNPKVMNRISKCLVDKNIEIEFISHDRQSAAIYFGIKENDRTYALLNMLHKELIE
ncbi:MAG: hypothetical protein DRN71_00220 [Candidatus Nanohalarchaeota archaeon]|nr:MAG: hypothetical protein DRN71_00220 [Candidatus Nanohaloarchaeota archaeon]